MTSARLTALLAVAAALLAFAGIAGEMREGETLDFDRSILLALRDASNLGHPMGPPWLVEVARDVTSLGSTAMLTGVTLAAAGYFVLVRRRRAVLLFLAATIGGAILSTLLKLAFQRPRPDVVLHGVGLATDSFPSGHAMLSAVTYLTLGALVARSQVRSHVKAYAVGLAALTTILVGISRIYLGVRWPTDVLAGWCVGAAWALLCWMAASSVASEPMPRACSG